LKIGPIDFLAIDGGRHIVPGRFRATNRQNRKAYGDSGKKSAELDVQFPPFPFSYFGRELPAEGAAAGDAGGFEGGATPARFNALSRAARISDPGLAPSS